MSNDQKEMSNDQKDMNLPSGGIFEEAVKLSRHSKQGLKAFERMQQLSGNVFETGWLTTYLQSYAKLVDVERYMLSWLAKTHNAPASSKTKMSCISEQQCFVNSLSSASPKTTVSTAYALDRFLKQGREGIDLSGSHFINPHEGVEPYRLINAMRDSFKYDEIVRLILGIRVYNAIGYNLDSRKSNKVKTSSLSHYGVSADEVAGFCLDPTGVIQEIMTMPNSYQGFTACGHAYHIARAPYPISIHGEAGITAESGGYVASVGVDRTSPLYGVPPVIWLEKERQPVVDLLVKMLVGACKVFTRHNESISNRFNHLMQPHAVRVMTFCLDSLGMRRTSRVDAGAIYDSKNYESMLADSVLSGNIRGASANFMDTKTIPLSPMSLFGAVFCMTSNPDWNLNKFLGESVASYGVLERTNNKRTPHIHPHSPNQGPLSAARVPTIDQEEKRDPSLRSIMIGYSAQQFPMGCVTAMNRVLGENGYSLPRDFSHLMNYLIPTLAKRHVTAREDAASRRPVELYGYSHCLSWTTNYSYPIRGISIDSAMLPAPIYSDRMWVTLRGAAVDGPPTKFPRLVSFGNVNSCESLGMNAPNLFSCENDGDGTAIIVQLLRYYESSELNDCLNSINEASARRSIGASLNAVENYSVALKITEEMIKLGSNSPLLSNGSFVA